MFVFCKAFEEVGECCQAIFCPRDRPSPIFTLFSWCINIIVLIITAVHMSDSANDTSGSGCTNSNTVMWNWGMIAIAGLNMMFAVYIYCRFVCKVKNEGMEAGKGAYQLFMYDFGVYFYFWFIVGIIVWLAMSTSWTRGEVKCQPMANTSPAIIVMVLYLVLGTVVISMSLMTECCSQPRYMTYQAGQPQNIYRQQQAPAPVQYAAPQHAYAAPPQQNVRPPPQNPNFR